MTLKLDPNNPLATKVQTRDERKARILCADFQDPMYPIIAAVQQASEGSGETIFFFRSDGQLLAEAGGIDLINIPPEPRKVERWFNVYDDVSLVGLAHETERQAHEDIATHRGKYLATLPVIFEIPAEIADKIEGGGE